MRIRHGTGCRKAEQGTILVLALIIVALVMVLVADATQVARVEWEATHNADLELRLEYAVRGGYEIAKAYLADDLENAGDVDSLVEPWSSREGIRKTFDPAAAGAPGGYEQSEQGDIQLNPEVAIFIEDEERKWPLPLLKVGNDAQKDRRKEGLANVLDEFRKGTILDVDPGTADIYARMIAEFLNREEGDQGFGPTPRPNSKTGLPLHVTDLALIPGLPPELLFDQVDEEGRVIPGLINVVTLWSDLTVNVNTASEAVLRGLFRRKADEASVGSDIFLHRESKSEEWLEKELAAGRDPLRRDLPEERRSRTGGEDPGARGEEEEEEGGGVFQAVDDVKQEINTVTDRIFSETRTMMTVQSKVFSVWVEAEMQGIRRVRRYVVRREGARFVPILSEVVSYPHFRELTQEEYDEAVGGSLGR